MTTHTTLTTLLACGALATLTGCSSTPPIRYTDLPISRQLQPTDSDTRPYAYSETTRWDNYSAVIIEPIAIYTGPDNQFNSLSESDKRELVAAMDTEFRLSLGTRFRITDTAKPGTLRLRLTLTGAKGNTAVVSTFTRFDLVGLPYNAVQSFRGKEGIFMGSVNYSVALYDAMTDQLLKAYLARQYPNAMNVGATFGSLSAAKTGLEKGAQELLAELR